MLTDRTILAARPGARPRKLTDGGGLRLLVRPNGSRSWQMRLRLAGREQVLSFGSWPDVSIADARARRDEARAQLDRGEDPRGARQSAAQRCTFEQIARNWHTHRRARWSTTHAADVLTSLERFVFPALGAAEIGAIDAPAVLSVVQAIEATGALVTARRVRQRLSQVFRFAIARELATSDPAASIAGELEVAPTPRHHPALTDVAECRALLAAVDELPGSAIAKLASQFLALTVVRFDSMRGARWDEIEGIDWSNDAPAPAAMWRVPAARMKLRLARKAEEANTHLVPLSPAAVEVLRQARRIAGASKVIFPGRRSGRTIGERAIGTLYASAGFAGRHTPHGWRASFSTILNEQLPGDRAAIDQALAHAAKDKVEAAYNRAAHLERRRFLFETWADLLVGGSSDGWEVGVWQGV